MPRAKKTAMKKSVTRKSTPRRKTTQRRKNIVGNFRGEEDIFWTKVINGFKKFLEPSFK
jgi:hypothetical protein